ncbi:hypothetical protein BKH42_08985 [Helicobacter sp. 13S00482-2]|uniref:hypothetical protein n=1 Tax=Helicobacter sp. 13S00482-2 TaxID=1476200 RepID=UPI000BA79D17|nr:hypothetical protein [Helicobacter sp. 13S00482-2]PAF52891.1 hypothetical protein BKH42_08985 [Helicobacter sp. 13S00482-2]
MYQYKDSSEQLKQGGYDYIIQNEYHYINIGATTVGQLKKAGILPNKNYSGLTQNKPDGLVLQGKDSVRVLIEYKKDGIFFFKTRSRKKSYSVVFCSCRKIRVSCYLCE